MTNAPETTKPSTRVGVLRYLPGWTVAMAFALLFLTLGMSRVESTGFSPSRGFRLLGGLFGGFWEVVITIILSLMVLAVGAGILDERKSKLVRGGMLVALLLGAGIVGALGVYKLVPLGSIVMIVIFMAATALQTWLEAKFNLLGGDKSLSLFARRAKKSKRNRVSIDDTNTPAPSTPIASANAGA